jgi:hypothetical protein
MLWHLLLLLLLGDCACRFGGCLTLLLRSNMLGSM